MTVQTLFRKLTDQFKPGAAEVEGTIEEMRVLDGERERWLLRLDTRKDAEFVFEPSPISRPRKKGQRVRIGYAPEPTEAGQLRADWIAAA